LGTSINFYKSKQMKTLTFLLLIMSLVGYGQNKLQVLDNNTLYTKSGEPYYKCPVCKIGIMTKMAQYKDNPYIHAFQCGKCGNMADEKMLVYKAKKPVIKTKQPNRFDKEFKKADSTFDIATPKHLSDFTISRTNYDNNYPSIGSYNSDVNTAKVTIESNGKFTINLDGFKVTDTIWITAGKRKVGIPAFKFLEYFKDEPTVIWSNGSLFNHITPTDGRTLEYKIVTELPIK